MVRPSIVALVDLLVPAAFQGAAYRHIDPTRDPLSGAGAPVNGGRWNPRESFAVLYLGLSPEVVHAEFERMASRAGRSVSDFLPRTLVTYEIALVAVDLRADAARRVVELTEGDIAAADASKCQDVGEAAHYLGREGILGPSPRAWVTF